MGEYKLQIAELFIRVFAGILFLFQGYDKLFRIKMPDVIRVFAADAQKYNIPAPLLSAIAWYTSLAEFLGGFLLLMGLFTTYALCALGLDLLLVSLAFSFLNPLWDMKQVLPRILLVVILLLFPEDARMFSLDYFLNLNK